MDIQKMNKRFFWGIGLLIVFLLFLLSPFAIAILIWFAGMMLVLSTSVGIVYLSFYRPLKRRINKN